MGKGGGGSGGGGGAQSGTQETIQREAPGVESRKLALYDEAVKLAQQPVTIPAYQVAGPTGLEQTGFQQAAVTGVGQPAVGQGIAGLQAGQQATNVGLGAALAGPNISQFFNPYQSYVTDEINRQAQIAQNQQAAQAVSAGAFGGGREGVQRAELDRARLEAIGQSRAQGFGTALQAAQNLQGLQAQTGLQAGAQFGQLGQALTGVGAQQQAMQQADIQSLLQAGGVQRALGQQALEAQRATSLAQQYEPYQRVEFLKNVMTNLPTGQSSITATTAPGSNPLAQAAGAGLGAYTAYNLLKRKEGGLVSIKKFQNGGLNEIKPPAKKQEGVFSEQERFALLAAPVIGSLLQGKTAPGQSNLQALFGSVGQGVSQMPEVALQIKKLDIAGKKEGTERTIYQTMSPEEVKAAGYLPGTIIQKEITITKDGNIFSSGKYDVKKESGITKLSEQINKQDIPQFDSALELIENKFKKYIDPKTGEVTNIPGIGFGGQLNLTSEGRENKDTAASFRNILFKYRAGSSQTAQELENLKQEVGSGFRSQEDALKGYARLRSIIESDKKSVFAGYKEDEVKAYSEASGIKLKKSPFESLGKPTETKKSTAPSYKVINGKLEAVK